MKKLVYIIALLFPMLVIGQTPTENYVKTTTYLQPVDEGQEDNLDDSQKIESINYVDGLGRAKQSIAVRAGGDKQNIISYIEYDIFCLLYTSPSPRDQRGSRMPSSA